MVRPPIGAAPDLVVIEPPPAIESTVEGLVRDVRGQMAVIQVPDGRRVRVDISGAPPIAGLLIPGRTVAVYGQWTGEVLRARGAAVGYTAP